MKTVEVQLYDAFADRIFGGNIAGVVLAEGLPAEAMRKIAAELAAPTTGFALTCVVTS